MAHQCPATRFHDHLPISVFVGIDGKATKTQLTYSLAAKTYNGKAQGATITPKSGVGKATVYYTGTSGTRYTKSTAKPTNAGSYTVTVDIAAGTNYNALKNVSMGTFKINKANVAKVGVTIGDTAWTGKQVKPTKFTYNGIKFTISSNATVNAYGTNQNIGTGKIKITGKGNFTGTKTFTFNIVPRKTAVSKTTVGTGKLKVTWNQVSAAQKISRYQVRYRVAGTSKWITKAYLASASSTTLTGLTKGKVYEVQVRSYKNVSGARYYSAWSTVTTSGKVR